LARIEGVPEDSSLFSRLVYALTRRKLGRMVEPTSVAAHHPRLLLGMGAFEEALGRSRRVPLAVKTLAELQVSTRIGCPF
jgi:hypothetical protein